jgi:two-component system, sensor histidine kinase
MKQIESSLATATEAHGQARAVASADASHNLDGDIAVRAVAGYEPNGKHATAQRSWPSPAFGYPAIEELLRADRRKDEFLAILSHELRSPLASIQNALGILRKPAGENPLVRDKMHELIDRQVRQITLLAAGLLDVSRITHGQLRLQRERIDLRAVLCNAIETLEADIEQRGHRLVASWPESSIWVLADHSRLEQVFVNLLGNAAKYTNDGGELALSMRVCDQIAVVRVRDSGVGISAQALPHIFDLFHQADPSAPRSRSGLGVGLGLVRTIVGLHGGSVTAESAGLDQGSEFVVHLPCVS